MIWYFGEIGKIEKRQPQQDKRIVPRQPGKKEVGTS